MNKKHFFMVIFFSFFLTAVMVFNGNAVTYTWKLDSQKNGYSIYISPVPGQRFKAAKCISTVNAPIEVIGVVLRDIPAFTQWMADCKIARILKVVNEADDIFIFYYHQGVPIIKDRDVVLKSHIVYKYKKGYVKVGFHSTNEIKHSPDKSAVRMKGMTGMWLLEYIDRNHTRCTYMVNANIGGSIPGWLANRSIRQLPLKSMQGLKKMVKMKKYIERAKKSKYLKKVRAAIKAGYLKG